MIRVDLLKKEPAYTNDFDHLAKVAKSHQLSNQEKMYHDMVLEEIERERQARG